MITMILLEKINQLAQSRLLFTNSQNMMMTSLSSDVSIRNVKFSLESGQINEMGMQSLNSSWKGNNYTNVFIDMMLNFFS